jgi:hypothetical protein
MIHDDWFEMVKYDQIQPLFLEHYAAFGDFISAFNGADAECRRVARRLAGPTDAAGKEIDFEMLPFGAVVKLVKRCLEHTTSAQANITEIERCIDHLKKISEHRNNMSHSMISVDADGISTYALIDETTQIHQESRHYHLDILRKLRNDAYCIAVRLNLVFPDQEGDIGPKARA